MHPSRTIRPIAAFYSNSTSGRIRRSWLNGRTETRTRAGVPLCPLNRTINIRPAIINRDSGRQIDSGPGQLVNDAQPPFGSSVLDVFLQIFGTNFGPIDITLMIHRDAL